METNSYGTKDVIAEVRSHLISKPYGTYFACSACGQTWWGDGKFGDRGEYHKLDCWLNALGSNDGANGQTCDHRWVDADNRAVKGTEICAKCFSVRAKSNATVEKE